MRLVAFIALATAAAFHTQPPLASQSRKTLVSFTPPELPLDFGSGNAQWRFEWPSAEDDDDDDEIMVAEVPVGFVQFVTCHLCGIVLTQQTQLGRVLGAAAFLATQRPLKPARVADSFRFLQSIPVAMVGPTPWPLVALGASVPVFQATLVPSLLAGQSWAFAPPALTLDAVLLVPLCEELVFRVWAMEAARAARIPYTAFLLADGVLFGAWHGAQASSLGFAVLGAYWAHLYGQTRNALVPIAMHALWNLFALTNIASFAAGAAAAGAT